MYQNDYFDLRERLLGITYVVHSVKKVISQ